MKIQKLLHSCLLIEEGDTRILIDPGSWTFETGALKVSDIPRVDAVFITHPHADHCFVPAIKEFVARDGCKVVCNSDIVEVLKQERIETTQISIPETITISDFTVTSTVGAHEPLPVPVPLNNGFYINHRLFHPGDCTSFEKNILTIPEVLALPILAPWGTLTRAAELAIALKPKHVIPIHDGFVKQSFHGVLEDIFSKTEIQFHPLKPGEILEI